MEKNDIDYDLMRKILDDYVEKGMVHPILEQSMRNHIDNHWLDQLKRRIEEQLQQKKEIYEKEIQEQYDRDNDYAIKKNEERRIISQERKEKRKFELYAKGIGLIALTGVITIALVKTPIGGKFSSFCKESITNIEKEYNQFLEDNEKEKEIRNQSIEERVYNNTGMTIDEIVEKGKSIH